jgi:pimeloyl-ACP methyl ester carboxylesterase
VGNEISAITEIAADAIDRFAITPAEMLHAGIARRVFASIGVTATPTRVIHDRIATSSYSLTRKALLGAAVAMAAGFRTATDNADIRPLSNSRPGRFMIGAFNGFAGDRLAERSNDLAIRLAVRHRGKDLMCTPDEFARTFPDATPKLAVFLHGLAETEEWWMRRRRDHEARCIGTRLRDDAGYTPVYVRYNTGLHVSENGKQFSELLESLTSAWPVAVQEIALIGHSMGGLVIRSACHVGTLAQHRWPMSTRQIVTLGTPHHGAPLAKAVHAAAWALHAFPESEPMAHVLDTRSAGIRDMRLGALHDDDWREERFDDFADRRREIPLLPGCQYTFITATVTADPSHRLGALFGDLLVRTESASGRHREHIIPVDPASVVPVGGLTHFDLLNHPLVYVAIRDVLSRSRPSPTFAVPERLSAAPFAPSDPTPGGLREVP